MFALDSDTLTHLFQGHSRVAARRQTVPASEIAITVVSWVELLMGRFEFLLKAADAEELLRAQHYLNLTRASLASVETVFPVDEAAAREFDRLRANKRLKKIGRADLLVASIVLANQATLVTRNRKDFSLVPGLRIENWAD